MLRKTLTSPDSLVKLIGQNSHERILTIDQFIFAKLPVTSSESSPREVYCIQTASRKKYFLKLNQYASNIENEYRAYKLIRHYAVSEFSTPEILDLQINVPYGEEEGQQCSWLLEEWLDGEKPVVENDQHFALFARILARINVVEVNLEQASRLFSTPVPNIDELAEDTRLRSLADLRRDLPIWDKNISLEFSKAIKYFENSRFPYMLNLNHGNYHMGNLMVRTKEQRGLIVLDWEDCKIDNPIYDLSHCLFFLRPCDWSPAIKIYFDHLGDIFVRLAWYEIVEMIISMYSVWAARNLRWSARRIDDPTQLSQCQEKITSHFHEIRNLSWESLVK